MLQIRRSEQRGTIEIDGRRFEPTSESWTIRMATPWLGLGYSYHRPHAVSNGFGSTAIRDHVMVARIAAIALAALTVLAWRMKP